MPTTQWKCLAKIGIAIDVTTFPRGIVKSTLWLPSRRVPRGSIYDSFMTVYLLIISCLFHLFTELTEGSRARHLSFFYSAA